MRPVAGLGVVVVAAAPVRVGHRWRGSARCTTRSAPQWRRRRPTPRSRTRRARGYPTAHSSTRIPPIDPPTTACQRAMPSVVGERGFDRDLVADRDAGEARSVRLAVGRVRRRARRALTAAEHVRAHHEPAVGVERRAGPDHAVPPAGDGVTRSRGPGGVTVAGERVQHQHRVRRVGRERPPRLVRDRDRGQVAARFERQRMIERWRTAVRPGSSPARHAPVTGETGQVSVTPLAARKPASRSAWMSCRVSMPTDRRTRSSVTPVATCSWASSCECVVVAGWMARLRTSPTLARWLCSSSASTNFVPASRPPLIPNARIAPAPVRQVLLARARSTGSTRGPGT